MRQIAAEQKAFFLTGATLDINYRIERLKELKNALIKYDDKIIDALHADLNKSSFESVLTETGIVLDELNYFIKNIKKWNKPKRIKVPLTLMPAKSMLYREPYGSALIISPWNYPLQLSIMPLIASIAAGNCSVIKLSEFSERTSEVIAEMIGGVFEPQYIRAVTGDAVTGAALLLEPFDYIFFTGNAKVGKVVLKAAAANLTPAALELGGKSPCIVDKSADIETAAKKIIWGKSLNAGQTCVAPDYVLIHSRIKTAFIKEITAQAEKLYGAHSIEYEDFPKIISKRHYERALELIDPAKTVYGGMADDINCKIDLTIMDDISWRHKSMQEEIFAPILPVVPYTNIDDVIPILQNKEKPLALYLFAKDKELEEKVVNNLQCGSVCINDTVEHISSRYAPFGGAGASGMGQYHGKFGLETFSRLKHVYKKSGFFDNPLKYFPKDNKEKRLRFWFYR
ncbi:MAG: aldehyde dehydrogenase family protein [Mucispirillum sp.]|nr:aldehyde dehydrogenase family protein [Mucispirillum sp.]